MTVDQVSGSLERVLVRFGRMVHSIGRRRGLAEAELDELTQEVRVRLWHALRDSEKIERVSTSYVYRAAMTAALDMIRRGRARAEESLDSGPREVVAATRSDAAMERRELAERIEGAVRELREPRDVVVRLHLSGYDRHEIADLLGWSEPKVRNLLYRGLADLRALLEREEIDPERVP